MRLQHFQTLQPVCPLCRRSGLGDFLVTIAMTVRGHGAEIDEGVLRCANPACQCEYPIIDGIPVLVPDIQQFLADRQAELTLRDDLSGEMAAIIGEGAGPGSWLDSIRQHLSSYTWDHYGEFDPRETHQPRPGQVARVAARGVELAGGDFDGLALDLGCSVGRSTFELAACGRGVALGIDMNIPMLRLARRVLREGMVRYDRRKLGLIYERREFPVSLPAADRVDFWAADALCLPFADGTFSRTMAMNLLDCVNSPLDLLRSMQRATASHGRFVVGCPYDWSSAVAQTQTWLGGHSPRGFFDGDSPQVLRAILTPGKHPVSLEGVRIVADDPAVPWQVRMHERYTAMYTVDVVAAENTK